MCHYKLGKGKALEDLAGDGDCNITIQGLSQLGENQFRFGRAPQIDSASPTAQGPVQAETTPTIRLQEAARKTEGQELSRAVG